ncbi:MAG: hypothetical protein VYE40_17815, partial [Myxococcota bacterium]|nr:hypothetical protein [Myxococcota bacterium]
MRTDTPTQPDADDTTRDEEVEFEFEDFGRAHILNLILYTHGGTREGLTPWRVSQIAFVLAALAHLWLEDAWQLDWLLADLFLLAGAAIILFLRGALLGWVLAIPGLLLPLLTARDQLTQSVILLLLATSAALSLGKSAYDRFGRGAFGRGAPGAGGVLSTGAPGGRPPGGEVGGG